MTKEQEDRFVRCKLAEKEKEKKSNTICAWCGAELENNPKLPQGITSHGICLDCKEEFFS